ncbi:hypothetical protein ACW5R3_01700 [Bizionia sp. KMM 8389]
MNENLQKPSKQNSSEEIDLVHLFKIIGNAFNKLVNFIASIFKGIFSIIIFTLKAVIVNIKLIVIVMVLAGVLGYVLEKSKPTVYSSSMLIKPYFDSKYQFITNIGYYNALLDNDDYQSLSEIFEIDEQEATNIVEFAIEPGPETENNRIVQYHQFLQSIDTTSAEEITYDDFISNRSVYSDDLFQVSVYATRNDIFKDLEKGVTNSFTNGYSEKRMQKRDSLLSIQKDNIVAQLKEVDSLQQIYIKVLESESESQAQEFTLGGEGFSFSKDKSNTREYDLLEKEISLRNELKALQEKKVDEDVFYDVISSFQRVGMKSSEWTDKYSLIFPVLAFILLCVGYILRKTVKFVKSYEA